MKSPGRRQGEQLDSDHSRQELVHDSAPRHPQFQAVYAESKYPLVEPEYVMQARKGSKAEKVKVYDSRTTRKDMDKELTEKTIDFMTRQVKADKPFFVYLPYTLTHMPIEPSAEFEGKSGNGESADVLMQIDAYTGRLLDTISELGVEDNTIVIFTADNGGEMIPGYQGWSGPWSGSYFTGREGSLRVPFIMRWPGKVPAAVVSNEIVHQFDLYATLAKFAGGKVPTDRIIDSADMSDFFLGKSDKSGREGFVVYVGNDIHGVKWRNWKMLFKELDHRLGTGRLNVYPMPHFYNLYKDPKELYPVTKALGGDLWVRWPMASILTPHEKSLKEEPPIKPGAPDPYVPAKK